MAVLSVIGLSKEIGNLHACMLLISTANNGIAYYKKYGFSTQ